VLERTPTVDAVPVGRCRDCKYYFCEHCLQDNGLPMPNPDDFCSYGERLEPMKQIDKDTLAEILKGL
jgi:hypothetical protein